MHIFTINNVTFCEMWGFHSSEGRVHGFLGCCAATTVALSVDEDVELVV